MCVVVGCVVFVDRCLLVVACCVAGAVRCFVLFVCCMWYVELVCCLLFAV